MLVLTLLLSSSLMNVETLVDLKKKRQILVTFKIFVFHTLPSQVKHTPGVSPLVIPANLTWLASFKALRFSCFMLLLLTKSQTSVRSGCTYKTDHERAFAHRDWSQRHCIRHNDPSWHYLNQGCIQHKLLIWAKCNFAYEIDTLTVLFR